MIRSIMIVGVGGQGTLLASKILGHVLVARGHDVKLSEVHGMAQRGGSVVTHCRYGEKVFSPIVDVGEADYILAFEKLEAARWAKYLKEGGTLIANSAEIWPMPVLTGAQAYPAEIVKKLGEKAKVIALDALTLAQEAGSAKAVNVVLLGVLSKHSDIPEGEWLEAIEQNAPARFIEMNKTAFRLGREATR
ncbi:MAG: indolepyruvate oxidoreductase subunit beta [Christensenellales bacterium]|jgi:indolepyruvate ferredoxin oxidoreductase beta subunit